MTGRMAFFGLMLGCVSVCVAEEPPAMRFSKQIERDPIQESILGVALDSDVYDATRDGFPGRSGLRR